MISFRTSHTNSPFLRMLQCQNKIKLPSYPPDYPLVFFIVLTRIASGLSLVSVLFSPSLFWLTITLICMVLGVLTSIVHLSVPLRFITMIRNNKSPVVWEVRLAGALSTVVAVQFISLIKPIPRFEPFLTWIGCFLSILFLISTGYAYQFKAHPVWRTSILPIYYFFSAAMVGFVLRAVDQPFMAFPWLCLLLIAIQAILLSRYKNHVGSNSAKTLGDLIEGHRKWVLWGFLLTTLLAPASLAIFYLLDGMHSLLLVMMAFSYVTGIVLERILFFRIERPNFFLSFIGCSGEKGHRWIRG